MLPPKKKNLNPAQKAKKRILINEDTPATRQDSVFVQMNGKNRAEKLKAMGYELSADPLQSFAGNFTLAHQDMYKSYQDVQKKYKNGQITQVIKKNQEGKEYRTPQVYNPLVYRQDNYLNNPNLYRSQEVKDIGVLNENVPYGVFDYRIAPTNKQFWFNEETGDGVTNYDYDFGNSYNPKPKGLTSSKKKGTAVVTKQKINSASNQKPKQVKTKLTDTPANFIFQNKLAYGTNQDGIMKKGMNPRKKYANGTNSNGVGPNNYIPNPNEVLSDYNIMLAKADQEVANNSLVPIVGMVGGLLQQGLGMASSYMGSKGTTQGGYTVSGDVSDTTNPEFQSPIEDRFKTAANGNNNVQANVEVEGGEMYETPQGETGEFEGPSHEEGGIPMEVGEDIPEGTKVYSDRLKIGKETLAERKEKRERQIANLEKALSGSTVDLATKNATRRRMQAIEKEESADLQFQEQVNSMQAMADNVIAAFGTGVDGVQKMAYGTDEDGIGDPLDIKSQMFSPGVANSGFKTPKFKFTGNAIADYAANPREYMNASINQDTYFNDANNTKTFQDWMDANNPNWLNTGKSLNKGGGYGNYDENTKKAAGQYFNTFKEGLLPAEKPVNNNFGAGDFLDTYASTVGTTSTEVPEVDKPGNMVSRGLEKGMNFIDKQGGLPNMGDLVGLFGDYLGATSGLKNAAEQRSTDITHTNVYKNAGKESQKQLDNAMQSIEGAKAQAILKATTTNQGGKRSGRNSARGVNQMRAMDWLYDTALQQQIAEISANAANQVSDIFKTKSNVALSADQLIGEGQYKANMANEAAKDAYYTAKGLALRDQALGVQQGGKDLNAIKQNKIIENLMKNYGTYVTADSKGKLKNK